MSGGSKVLKCDGFRWAGVPVRPYQDDPGARYHEVTRQTLLGEGDGEADLAFISRYFEIAPGGWSTLEHHRHPHSVVVLRGRGEVALEGRAYEIAPYDVVYVAPGAVHQFRASRGQPLGFLCVVDRVRDRPQVVVEGARGSAP